MGRRGAFAWDDQPISALLEETRFLQGLLMGRLAEAPGEVLADLAEQAIATEVIASARIEGTELDADLVSAALEASAHADSTLSLTRSDNPETERARAIDAVSVALDATADCFGALGLRRMAAWHEALFASGHAGSRRAEPGRYRTERFGEEPSERVMEEMGACLAWLDEAPDDLLLAGALAHLAGFLIRPFATGNGRIMRTLSELILMRSDALAAAEARGALDPAVPSPLIDSLLSLREGRSATSELPPRLYGLSPCILEGQSAYKTEIVKARDRMKEATALAAEEGAPIACNVTDWLAWYLTALKTALSNAVARIPAVPTQHAAIPATAPVPQVDANEDASRPNDPSTPALTPRQHDALERLAAAIEADGTQANRISTGAWAQMCDVSTDTALRDITDLLHKGILVKDDKRAGRSTSYRLVDAWLEGSLGS